MAFYTFSYFEYKHKSSLMDSLQIQQNTANKHVAALQRKILAVGSSDKEAQKIKQQIYTATENLSSNGSKHFYSILETLGNQINTGVWLNYINLDNAGKVVSLAGYTIQPQNAMSYVSALNKTSLFENTPFKLDTIRNINKENYLYIQLKTQNNNQENS